MLDRSTLSEEIEADPVACFIEHAGGTTDTLLQRIPTHMQPGLVRYLLLGIKPGSFLLSVLAGEKELAERRADAVNTCIIPTYFAHLAQEWPQDSWGSSDKVRGWVERGGKMGREIANA
ncbi:hypothetical protein A8B82_15170 [Sulfitobacter sp. EhC04]|uniref:hypothetical protein n=1 Tax=Sulfitobacter sp. EhC04 TaxID=1849168 RepID=UPI0007F52F60|nr:hypothetical protein [Sulfitobacter sp. EhC04]OAN76733.1 hypothetical protein A8B82_15170 [Sulfitobacter sp. EhC04]